MRSRSVVASCWASSETTASGPAAPPVSGVTSGAVVAVPVGVGVDVGAAVAVAVGDASEAEGLGALVVALGPGVAGSPRRDRWVGWSWGDPVDRRPEDGGVDGEGDPRAGGALDEPGEA